jgi:hypothetical protein
MGALAEAGMCLKGKAAAGGMGSTTWGQWGRRHEKEVAERGTGEVRGMTSSKGERERGSNRLCCILPLSVGHGLQVTQMNKGGRSLQSTGWQRAKRED